MIHTITTNERCCCPSLTSQTVVVLSGAAAPVDHLKLSITINGCCTLSPGSSCYLLSHHRSHTYML